MKWVLQITLLSIIIISCNKLQIDQELMSGPIVGVGAQFYRWDGNDWEAIAEVRAIVGPSMNKDTINVTSLDTADGYNEFTSGFLNGGEISLAMSFTRTYYELFKTDFEANISCFYGIMLPDEEQTFLDFTGLVTELPLGIASDDKIDVNVKIKISGVLGTDASSGEFPEESDIVLITPSVLEVEQIEDYVQVNFVDNTGGDAQHEIWSRRTYWGGTDAWVLVTTLNGGVTTYNDHTWQNATVEYRVRAKSGATYSDYCSVVSILTNWTFKVTVTAGDLTVNIFDIHLYAYNKLVVLHWGDGTTTDATDVHTHAYTHTYPSAGVYWWYMTGDVDWINFFQWYDEYAHLAGTYCDKWVLPSYFQFGHLYGNNMYGDLTNFKYPPMCLGCHFGGNFITYDITNLEMPTNYWDLHLLSHIADGIHGDINGWAPHPAFAHFYIYGNVTGDLTGYFSTWTPNYGGVIVRLYSTHATGFYGDLSTWNMPDKPWDIDVSLGGCHFTGFPRGLYAGCYKFDFGGNNCDSQEIDDFLEYLDAYFTGDSDEASSEGTVIPRWDCDYTLTGANMGTPSATGLAHRNSIIAKYADAGFTCNIYVNS
jgi:hypothetical protein